MCTPWTASRIAWNCQGTGKHGNGGKNKRRRGTGELGAQGIPATPSSTRGRSQSASQLASPTAQSPNCRALIKLDHDRGARVWRPVTRAEDGGLGAKTSPSIERPWLAGAAWRNQGRAAVPLFPASSRQRRLPCRVREAWLLSRGCGDDLPYGHTSAGSDGAASPTPVHCCKLRRQWAQME